MLDAPAIRTRPRGMLLVSRTRHFSHRGDMKDRAPSYSSGRKDVRFYPTLAFVIDFTHVAPLGLDGRPDDHAYDAALLEQSAPRPEEARVVRHRHDLAALLRGQQCAAGAVPPGLAGRHARA